MFDMNGETVFLEKWTGVFEIDDEEYCLCIESNYSTITKVGEMKFTKMSSDKIKNADECLIYERCYEVTDVLDLL